MIVLKQVELVLERTSLGHNVFSVLNELNINPTEFIEYLNKNKGLQDKFNVARQLCTEKVLLNAMDAIDKADDTFSLMKANSKWKASQWMAEKLISPVYGIKQTIEVNNTIDIRGALESGFKRVNSVIRIDNESPLDDEPDILS